MYYLNPIPSENGNYGNPQSVSFKGAVSLPDELLEAYIETMGFAFLEVSDGIISSVTRNDEAYNDYINNTPEPTPEPEPDGDIWDEIADAIRNGVNEVD